MLNVCEKYALEHSMHFSTDKDPRKSKTKCMLFSTSRSANQIKPVCLNGDELPWVDSARHLGNYLSTKINNATKSPDTRTDLLQKRGILFDSSIHAMDRIVNM